MRNANIIAPIVLIASDALGFILAGISGLFFAEMIGNATWPTSLANIMQWESRERITDYLIAGLAWIIWFQAVKNRYRKPIPFWSEAIETTKVVALLALVDLALIAFSRNDFSRSVWMFGWLTLIPLISVGRLSARVFLIRLKWWSQPTWIIGRGENAREAVLALESEWQMGFSIQGYLTPEQIYEDGISDLSKRGNNRPKSRNLGDLVFVIALDDNEPKELSNLILKLTLASAQSIHIIPPLRGIPLYGAELSYFFSHEVLMLGIKNNLAIRLSKTIKRVFDFTLTVLLLLPSSLIFLMAGILIWFEDRGPIFFIQRRLGIDGKPFNMIKLRSMRQDADQMLDDWRSRNTLEWIAYRTNGNKLENDPRQLKIGRLLRRSSIDELPQLFNVLRGEMSLVGPRPILERESADYGADLILYKTTRPGMTGLWQVSGRSKASFQQRSSLDAWYIRNWSLTYDIIIILRTIGVVLSGRGAF